MSRVEAKKSLGAADIFFPGPIAMIVIGEENQYNIVTAALLGLVNCAPPMLSFTISKSRYSTGLLKEHKQVSINIASAAQMEVADYCGLVSGKNKDKIKTAHLTLEKTADQQAPIIKESPFHYVGRVVKEIEFQEMVMYIMAIEDVIIDQDKLDEKGKIDIKKVDPLVYCTTVREYWSLNEKLGEGYKAGVPLLKEGN